MAQSRIKAALMPLPALTPLAASLPETVPFVGPESIERTRGIRFRARLGANESSFGPSPAVIAAIAAAAPESWKYCDPEVFDLRQALARHHGVTPDEVSVGEGIDGLLGHCIRLFAAPGDVVVTSIGAYPTFNYHVTSFGARLHAVPYRDDREDLDALLAAVRETDAKIVYLANPDNPMGTWWDADAVTAFADALPPTTLLLLDEAYGEFAPPGTLPPIDTGRGSVLHLRTFSKAYGLAGLRCGYAIGPGPLTGAFNRVRNHFGVSSITQAAALAALADQDYLASVVTQTGAARQRIDTIARANGLIPLPSATNFVAVDCGRDGAFAQNVLNALTDLGVFIRKPMAPRLDRCIRITAGTDAMLNVLETALPEALTTARR
ncbi:MAG: Histidinol-phosphate aminotransferase e [Devosia sp.]|uniref:pyridoxal phosphate-dependent aminotransferase n=1 Tax=Devosia sp. TaxID=1871048 RepID=UPI002610EAC0|nr:pyridoxal phosphate-dependent aminotransferase [Devosia sp.]MDB5588692.1 Histidinol-phosphate aminotransferase e [Devosia sp.]